MSYTKTIVCLAASRKHGDVCIAGREIAWGSLGPWLRPVSARPGGELNPAERALEGGGFPQLLDVVDVPLLLPAPCTHQAENHVIDPTRRWVKRDQLSFADLAPLSDNPETLWTNSGHSHTGRFNCISPQQAAAATGSLYLVVVPKLFLERILKPDGSPIFRGTFTHNLVQYKLPVTDSAATASIAYLPSDAAASCILQSPFLCISLSHPFAGDNRCHKLIAGVLSAQPL